LRWSEATLSDPDFDRLSAFIQSTLGIKMPAEKRSMLEHRLSRRLKATGIATFDEYVARIFEEDEESTELLHMIDAVTTNKTEFFREPDHFERLQSLVLPELRSQFPGVLESRTLRVWSSACSSGEEPYSISMALLAVPDIAEEPDFEILGTDLSTRMLGIAAHGIYPSERVEHVSEAFKKAYLLRSKDPERKEVRVAPEVRRHVRFERFNLLHNLDTKRFFHIVFCRNVLIYFDRPTQISVLRRIMDRMLPGAFLFVGHSETLHGMELPLEYVAPTIYRKPLMSS
jgi:chemotaxis protein methyltransferase CheR